MARRSDYTIERDSVAAGVNRLDPYIVEENQIIWERGVRGGMGIMVMPAVTQYFKDNYFSNQTVDQALASPWSGNNDLVKAEYNLLEDYSVRLDGPTGDANAYLIYQTSSVMTVSGYIYAPPPFNLNALKFYNGNGSTTAAPTQTVSLGDYWYFSWLTATGQNGASDRWGVFIDNSSNPHGYCWVSNLSLTQTSASVGFIPNSSTTLTATSEDNNLKYTLIRALPQSGSMSFVVIPYFDNDGSAIDDDPTILAFYPSDGDSTGDDYLLIQIDDNGSQGIYAEKKVGGGSAESTGTTGYAATGFINHTPTEIVLTWDFAAGGTKRVNIFANGELVVESNDWDEGFPTNLTDFWCGVERTGASTYGNHAQSIIQDFQIFRRSS